MWQCCQPYALQGRVCRLSAYHSVKRFTTLSRIYTPALNSIYTSGMKAGLLTALTALWCLTMAGHVAGMQPVLIEGSDFQNWSATTQQTTLPDGSVLTEYAAATKTDPAAESSIIISFIPRFACSPLISVIVPESSQVSSDWQNINLQIDGQMVPFGSIADRVTENSVRLTYNASSADQSQLLSLLDSGNRANLINDSLENTAVTDKPEAIVSYSLMGSRLSARAALTACQAHQPVPDEATGDID